MSRPVNSVTADNTTDLSMMVDEELNAEFYRSFPPVNEFWPEFRRTRRNTDPSSPLRQNQQVITEESSDSDVTESIVQTAPIRMSNRSPLNEHNYTSSASAVGQMIRSEAPLAIEELGKSDDDDDDESRRVKVSFCVTYESSAEVH